MHDGDNNTMTSGNYNTEINLDQLATINPFVVAVDEQLVITWASKLMLKRVANIVGLSIPDIIECIEPREDISQSSIVRNIAMPLRIMIKDGDGSIPLIGRWISFHGGFVLLANPDIRTPDDLDKFSLDEFSEDDLTVELLTTREEYHTSLQEAKLATDTLREANKAAREWTDKLESINAELKTEITKRKQAEDQLKKTLAEIERFNKLMITREGRVIEMKKEVNTLLAELGREPKYKSVPEK